jgi:ABC-type branched-subunit amino acid transport system permease subunit
VALMILTGFAGQISLGHAAFLALGAYTTAILGHRAGVPFWLCLPAGGVNPTRAKLLAFGLSSFFAGIAGAMFALQQQYITVDPPFDLSMSVAY